MTAQRQERPLLSLLVYGASDRCPLPADPSLWRASPFLLGIGAPATIAGALFPFFRILNDATRFRHGGQSP